MSVLGELNVGGVQGGGGGGAQHGAGHEGHVTVGHVIAGHVGHIGHAGHGGKRLQGGLFGELLELPMYDDYDTYALSKTYF